MNTIRTGITPIAWLIAPSALLFALFFFLPMGLMAMISLLAGNPVVLDSDPSSLINLVLNGAQPIVVKGTPDAYRMPEFRIQFSDRQIADVVTFIRNSWGNHASAVTPDQVAAMRKATDPSSDQVVILKMR